MAEEIRVRIAPSPTGSFHIGTARTALFNYLFAKKNDGKFILRIEDTDLDRSEKGSLEDIVDGLRWLGLDWDEGPEKGGLYGPYFQHERFAIYRQYVDQLVRDKAAYRCYCSKEELDNDRKEFQKNGEAPRYNGRCRNLTQLQVEKFVSEGRPSVVRFIVDPQKVVFDDIIRGRVEFDAKFFGDFVIVRSDGNPLFALTNAIDDNLMKITHILRGEEHLPNTAKQILLAKKLNIFSPQFGHFPLILNIDKTKMSKRRDPVSVTKDFKEKGYLNDALVNFIALLGWNPGDDREIFTLKELIDEFDVKHVGKSPSIFDTEKLRWMNGYYIRTKTIGDLATETIKFIKDKKIYRAALEKPDYFMSVLALVHDRIKTYAEIEEHIDYFYQSPKYDAELLVLKKSTKERTAKALEEAIKVIKDMKKITVDDADLKLRQAARKAELEDGEVLWSVRVALCGRKASPSTFELLEIMGQEESLKRMKVALKKLS